MYTEWYWSCSLAAFARVCSLRTKDDAQKETRYIANCISIECNDLYPVSWKALDEDNGYEVKASCYNLKIDKLNLMENL